MNDQTETVGNRIRAIRSERGVTLRTLARTLGLSPASLSNIERGRVNLSLRRLQDIAETLNVQLIDLLQTTDEAQTPAQDADPQTQTDVPQDWRSYAPLDLDPVLTAALAEFQRAGYHGTSMRDIANAAGMSVSGMYHHYVSKQEMLYYLLHIGGEDLLTRANAACQQAQSPLERFCNLIEHLTLWHCYRREIGFIGASEMRSLDPVNGSEIVELRRLLQGLIDQEVDAALQAGLFTSNDPQGAARAIVTMCVGIVTWYDPDGPQSPETIAAHYVEIALGAMGAKTD